MVGGHAFPPPPPAIRIRSTDQPARRVRFSRLASRFCCGVFSAVFFACFFESLFFAMGLHSLLCGPKRHNAIPDRTGLSNRIAQEEFAAKLRMECDHAPSIRAGRTNSPSVKSHVRFRSNSTAKKIPHQLWSDWGANHQRSSPRREKAGSMPGRPVDFRRHRSWGATPVRWLRFLRGILAPCNFRQPHLESPRTLAQTQRICATPAVGSDGRNEQRSDPSIVARGRARTRTGRRVRHARIHVFLALA